VAVAIQDWKTGEGYPTAECSFDEWKVEFLRRGPHGLAGRPHFRLADGAIEFFVGPAIIQIQDDGSFMSGPDSNRSNITHMVLEFQLDQDIDAQIENAKHWLTANQNTRYSTDARRKRVTKYGNYLRATDASNAGASQSEIASVLYPHLDGEAGKKQVSNALKAAKKLISMGFHVRLKRR
jgi:hypothetical protein